MEQIPKCRKGRSVEDALNEFTGSSYAPPARAVWAESKYDGFRQVIGPVVTGQEANSAGCKYTSRF